jgi:NAD(P)-dependent dehydrogenase (short-subunit alcohol dehydrogenase family)
MNDMLSGRVAIVTGAGQGIGAGIAASLASFGTTLVIADVDGAKAEQQAAQLRESGAETLAVRHDVTDGESGFALADKTLEKFGKIDILVNNAGTSGRTPLVEMEPEAWDTIININLTGTQRTTRAIAPVMKDAGSGSIVTISSVLGRTAKPNMTHYVSSKFGVIGFAQALALELAPFGVRSNVVCPGIVRTRQWEWELAEIAEANNFSVDDAWQSVLDLIPLGFPQSAEDIGNAVAFLSSPLASSITGQALNVDGGYDMH